MLVRVAAFSFAAFLIAVPAYSGVEFATVADANASAAVFADAPPMQPAMPELASLETPDQASIVSDAEMGLQIKIDPEAEAAPEIKIEPEIKAEPDNKPADRLFAIAIQPEQQAPALDDDGAPVKLASIDPFGPAIPRPPVAEPFGLSAFHITNGNVLTKWSGVEADIRAGNKILAHCREDMKLCPAGAQNFLAIVNQGRAQTGRARIGIINRAVNLAIEPVSDMAQWGVPDRWSAPLETFGTGKGDCEDYAIAKYVALTAAGIAAEDVKLVIVRNTAAGEDHAVVTVRLDGNWIVLDNRWLKMVADNEMADAIPLFVLDNDGVRKFAAPALASTRRHGNAGVALAHLDSAS